jgi:hypothetical protein
MTMNWHEIFDYLRNYQLFKEGLEVTILKPCNIKNKAAVYVIGERVKSDEYYTTSSGTCYATPNKCNHKVICSLFYVPSLGSSAISFPIFVKFLILLLYSHIKQPADWSTAHLSAL